MCDHDLNIQIQTKTSWIKLNRIKEKRSTEQSEKERALWVCLYHEIISIRWKFKLANFNNFIVREQIYLFLE